MYFRKIEAKDMFLAKYKEQGKLYVWVAFIMDPTLGET
jgi:hypothetical protein